MYNFLYTKIEIRKMNKNKKSFQMDKKTVFAIFIIFFLPICFIPMAMIFSEDIVHSIISFIMGFCLGFFLIK